MFGLWGGVEMLAKQVSLAPHTCHESFVFHRVRASRLELIPELLDKSEIVAALTNGRFSQGRSICPPVLKICPPLDYTGEFYS